MSGLLSSAEMEARYQELAEQGQAGQPYLLHYTHGSTLLYLFGVSHSNDPEHQQWSILEREWQQFVAHQNPHKVVLYENSDASQASIMSKKDALKHYSESG